MYWLNDRSNTNKHDTFNRQHGGKIVGGSDADPGQFPYQISFQNKGSNFHFCGGSVLDEVSH